MTVVHPWAFCTGRAIREAEGQRGIEEAEGVME
jgi:hypothetical protein